MTDSHMQSLPVVTLTDGVPTTTTLAIAEGADVEHASVIKLVRTYQTDLEEFGRVGFEIAPFDTAGGTQQREIAILNEQQTTLIFTYMRNTDVVRDFKKRLVKAFYELAHSKTATPTQEPATIASTAKAMMTLAKTFGFKGNQAVFCADRATQQLIGVSPMALLGVTHLQAEIQEPLLTTTEVGLALGLGRTKINPHLEQHGLITGYRDHKNRQCWELTEKGKQAGGIYQDTGKKHGGGEPVRAIKWHRRAVEWLRGVSVPRVAAG